MLKYACNKLCKDDSDIKLKDVSLLFAGHCLAFSPVVTRDSFLTQLQCK